MLNLQLNTEGNNRMNLPNFIIVGAMKAGSSTLASYLSHHPDAFMYPHELHFFSDNALFEKGPDWYSKHFEQASNCHATGEKTATYSYEPAAPKRIHDLIPDIKLIWIFREPAARSLSNYWHAAKKGAETCSFEKAIKEDAERYSNNIYKAYLKRSIYADQVEHYLDFFPKENMLFLLFEELIKNSAPIEDTCHFLGIKPICPATTDAAVNRTYIPRSLKLQAQIRRRLGQGTAGKLMTRLNRQGKPGYPDPLSETQAFLKNYFLKHNDRLSKIIGKNLDCWS